MGTMKRKKKRSKAVDVSQTLLKGLTRPQEAAAYVEACLEEAGSNRTKYLLRALMDIAQAHGMSSLARGSESRRRTLYKVLSEDGNPRLETLESVLEDLGLTLAVKPMKKAG